MARHAGLRCLVARAFTLRYIERGARASSRSPTPLLDQVLARGSMEIVRDYAYPLPIIVISEMRGVPQDQMDQIRAWSEALSSWDPDAIRAFATYVKDLIAAKGQQPQDDLISLLL